VFGVERVHFMKGASVSSEWVRLNVFTLSQEGLDAYALCEASGIQYADLGSPYIRFSKDTMNRLWENAALLSNNPSIGLLFGKYGLMRGIKPAIYTLLSSPSLKLGLNRILPFQYLVSDFLNIKITQISEGFQLSLGCEGNDTVHYAAIDAALSGIVGVMRWVLPTLVNPIKVTFKHRCFSDRETYTKLFRCPVEFHSDINSIVFYQDDFEAPIPTADADLTSYYEQIMTSDLIKSQMMDLKNYVRSEILKNLPNGVPSIGQIASKQYMTARTLQRRLKVEGVAFKNLLDTCRKDLAVEYLCHGEMSMDKISMDLGFSETSSFVRAFRRWFDQTPGEYRESHFC